MSPLPAPRRIVTSNVAIPEGLSKVYNSKPAFDAFTEEIYLVSKLVGRWYDRPLLYTIACRLPTRTPVLISA